MKSKILSVAAAALMFAACNEPLNDAVENLEKDSNESESVSTKSHWGNKIEDPYTVTNMRLAFKELMKKENNSLSKAGVNEQQIEPTHLHLKFIPKNEEEWRILKKDTILNVVPVPFDYDLEGFDGVYRDPECPENQPTYQYSVVRVNHKLPNVEYVVLDSLFMPFEDDYDQETISKKAGFKQVWDDLELESMILTGNYKEEDYIPQTLSKKYHPDGKVEYTDKNLNRKVGVPNAKIHVNFSTHTGNCYTKSDGSFRISERFAYKVHYHVYFQNSDFAIFNCPYGYHRKEYEAAAYSGGRMITCNDFQIDKNEMKQAFATCHIAGYKYFSINYGIKNNLDKEIKLCVYNDNNKSKRYIAFSNTQDQVHVVNIDADNKLEFGSTINAITGIMLENIDPSRYYIDFFDNRLQESWRAAVENYMTKQYYGTYSAYDYATRGLIIDLMNHSSDYSLSTLQNYMNLITPLETNLQWDKFKEYVMQGKSASEKTYLENLFRNWENK